MADEEFKPTDLAEIVDGAEPTIEPQIEPTQEAVQATPEDAVKAEETTSEAKPDDTPEPVTETAEVKPEAEPVTEEKPENWQYAAYADEKGKRQGLEKGKAESDAENERLKAQLSALQYQQNLANQTPVEAPDMFDDAEAYTKHVQEQANANVMPQIQALRAQVAEQKHGAEVMQKADEWFNTLSPQGQQALNVRYGNTADPYGGLISEHKKSSLIDEIGGDVDAYKAKMRADIQAEMLTAAQTAPLTPETPQANNFMPSIVGAKSTSARGGPVWKGVQPLDQILPTN